MSRFRSERHFIPPVSSYSYRNNRTMSSYNNKNNRNDSNLLLEVTPRSRFTSFDPAEWRLQRCQQRIANLNLDNAFDKAKDKIKSDTSDAFNHESEQNKTNMFVNQDKILKSLNNTYNNNERTTLRNWSLENRIQNAKNNAQTSSKEVPSFYNKEIKSVQNKVSETKPTSVSDSEDEYTWESYSESEEEVNEIVEVPVKSVPEKEQTNKIIKSTSTSVAETKEILLAPVKKESANLFTDSPTSNKKPNSYERFKQLKANKESAWLDSKYDYLATDCMVTTLQNWLQNVKKWDNDPLDNLKGMASSTVLVSTKRTDPYPRLKEEVFKYKGGKNFHGKYHGKGVIDFENGDQFSGQFKYGIREGLGSLKLASGPILYLDGTYVNDKMEGKGKIEYRDGNILYAWFCSGTIHGLGKLYDKEKNIKHIGWYSNGKLVGTVWQFLKGGGCIIGEVDVTGNLIGDNIAFLYPDLKTVLLGTFIKHRMAIGQTCFVQMVTLRNEICHLRFTNARGPLFSFDPGTRDIICKEPLLPDPYESQYCYVRTSKIKGAREGLFARTDLPKDFIVAFYNGVKMRSDEIENTKDDWEANAYKIVDLIGPDDQGIQGILDIPAKYISDKNYKASSAHKANHSFEPNAKFTLFDNPRFGLVPAIITLDRIQKEEEITVSYDYAMDEAPPWYQDLFAKRIIDQYQKSKTWNF